MEKLTRLKASISRRSKMVVAESRQNISAAPLARAVRLTRGSTECAAPWLYMFPDPEYGTKSAVWS